MIPPAESNLIDMGGEILFDLLEYQAPRSVTDRPGAKELEVTGGEVVFDDIVFSYDAARPILKGVSIRVPAGKTVAIVGPSGSGKSTIGRLLFRFYDVASGSLRIDGTGTSATSPHDRPPSRIGVVPQTRLLSKTTIRTTSPTAGPSGVPD